MLINPQEEPAFYYVIGQDNEKVNNFLSQDLKSKFQLFPSIAFNKNIVDLIFDRDDFYENYKIRLSDAEVIDTICHLECWKAISRNNQLDDNDLILISNENIRFKNNLLPEDELKSLINFHRNSSYGIVCLNNQSGELYKTGEEVGSYVMGNIKCYDKFNCQLYLIRKSFCKVIMDRLKLKKIHFLFNQFSHFCTQDNIAHTDKNLGNIEIVKPKIDKIPTFSMIIPIYNNAHYLDDAILSIINQDIENYELILVNDGSTDNTAEICEYYRQKYPNKITVIHQPNSGVGVARNSGIKLARGKYLAFLDSDDYYMHNNVFSDIEKLILENNYPDMVLGNIYMGGSRAILGRDVTGDYKKDISVLADLNIYHGYAPTKFVKREIVIKNNLFFEELLLEDLLWTNQLVDYIDRYVNYIPRYYFYNQKNQNSIMTSSNPEKMCMDTFSVFESTLKIIEKSIEKGNYEYKIGLTKVMVNCHIWISSIYKSQIKDKSQNIIESFEKHLVNYYKLTHLLNENIIVYTVQDSLDKLEDRWYKHHNIEFKDFSLRKW